MKFLGICLAYIFAGFTFVAQASEQQASAPNAQVAEDAKPSGAPRVVVSYVVGQFVELEQQKDGSFKVTKFREEKNPTVFKDSGITMSDDELKKKVVAAIEQKRLAQGENVSLGKGEDLGSLVGGVAGAAGTVVGIVGTVLPHIEQIAGAVAGLAKFL